MEPGRTFAAFAGLCVDSYQPATPSLKSLARYLIYRKAEGEKPPFNRNHKIGAGPMVMTSDTVRHELCQINSLIEMLRNSFPVDDDDIDDLRWLIERRIVLRALLEVRRRQCGKKLVSLDIWRNGSVGRAARAVAVAA